MRKRSLSALARNKARIRRLAAEAPDDLEGLALLFEDDAIADDGTLPGRVRAVLQATERRLIPGLQTAVPFSDTGFAGDRRLDGAGFRDPWPSSRNQVGHFLTAVGLQLAPEVVSRPIPVLGSIRAIVGAPATMSDAEVALRLSIGHEKAADPRDAIPAAMRVLVAGVTAYQSANGAGAAAGEHATAAVLVESWYQVRDILGAFRMQFRATTDEDIAAWNEALRLSGSARAFNRRAVAGPRSPLKAIAVANKIGNSIQDLRLTLVGWRLGQLVGNGAFRDRTAVARWLRRALR